MTNTDSYVRWRLAWFAVSIAVVALDQLTKFVFVTLLADGPIAVFSFFTLRLACNSGAAFSILQGYTELLAVVGILFSAFFTYEIWRLDRSSTVMGIAYSLLLAGAVGNSIDRVAVGCVTDFIHLHYGSFSYPVFNVADTAITCGVTIWIIVLLWELRPAQRKSQSTADSQSDVEQGV